MLNLLAVADAPSGYLENRLSRPSAPPPHFDLILSCGDLPADYLDRLATLTNRVVYWVDGNHSAVLPAASTGGADTAVGVPLHGRVLERPDSLLAGFSGMRWHEDDTLKFSEKTMRRLCRRTRRRLWRIRFWEWLQGRPPRPLIIISHAPPITQHEGPGAGYQSFACFRELMAKTQPVLWLHGHVHLSGFRQIQKNIFHTTLVVNVYEFKQITLDPKCIRVSCQLGSDPDSGGLCPG